MRIFVLGTGRCGTMTFARACSHITNYTSGHETHRVHPERFPVYPDNHIEVDSHLAWMLGRLSGQYPPHGVKYIHLRRDKMDVARSWFRRRNAHAVAAMLFQKTESCTLEDMVRLVDIMESNICLFLKGRDSITVSIEALAHRSDEWWYVCNFIGATGDEEAGRNEFSTRYNASQPTILDVPDNMNRMTLNVTWDCNRRCPKCMQRKLIERQGGYHMTMEELETFIESSGSHRFETITLSGGEPLLWKNLYEGVARLRKANMAIQLDMFSNGVLRERITPALMRNLDQLRLSYYGGDNEPFWELRRQYGDKVQVVDRRVMVDLPTTFHPRDVAMPADCNCVGWMVTNGWAYACAGVPYVMAECGIDANRYPELICKVEPGYLQRLAPYVTGCYDLCRGCVSNLKVRRVMEERQ